MAHGTEVTLLEGFDVQKVMYHCMEGAEALSMSECIIDLTVKPIDCALGVSTALVTSALAL